MSQRRWNKKKFNQLILYWDCLNVLIVRLITDIHLKQQQYQQYFNDNIFKLTMFYGKLL